MTTARLADLVGPGDGWWRYELDERLGLAFGWQDGAFRIDATCAPDEPAWQTGTEGASATPVREEAGTLDEPAWQTGTEGASVTPVREEAFLGSVIPEATPNPRTIRFVTGPIHAGPSRWYASVDQADDPRVARLFDAFDDVANVLVGPDFVAVGIGRPDRWEALLVPMLRVVEATFERTDLERCDPADTNTTEPGTADDATSTSPDATVDVRGGGTRPATSLDHAWRQLSQLRPDDPDDVRQILDAASAPDVATRQVAARVLIDAAPDLAAETWRRLLDDPSRTVRRATVDVIVDAGRESLRPLLEHALQDADAWTCWKALRGLVDLGVERSRAVVAPLVDDPDFRVRLEATGALRPARGRATS